MTRMFRSRRVTGPMCLYYPSSLPTGTISVNEVSMNMQKTFIRNPLLKVFSIEKKWYFRYLKLGTTPASIPPDAISDSLADLLEGIRGYSQPSLFSI